MDIEAITAPDITDLIENKVAEGRALDYKAALPGSSDAEKKEFLRDIASFANAGGGFLIFGITDERDERNQATGRPGEIVGIGDANHDKVKQRLESMLLSSIDPRIPNLRLRIVAVNDTRSVLLIRVPKSPIGPHMVAFGTRTNDCFYSRNAGGKYPMDVRELRRNFSEANSLGERIQAWRSHRLGLILGEETVGEFANSARIILHVVPASFDDPNTSVDLAALYRARPLKPLYAGGWSTRMNIDGVLAYCRDGEATESYAQVFRKGMVESVDTLMLRPQPEGNVIPSRTFAESLLDSVEQYISLIAELGVELPVYVLTTLMNVNGYRLGVDRGIDRRAVHDVDRDFLHLSTVVATSFRTPPAKIVRGILDSLWQACGMERCLDYNEEGEWAPR